MRLFARALILFSAITAAGLANFAVYRAVYPPRRPISTAAVSQPPTVARIVPAHEARLSDSTEVIGVKVNGRPRAYLVDALATMSGHVCNDVLEQQPISVTYCDLDDHARVFTLDSQSEPLQLLIAGRGKEMMCWYKGELFGQQQEQTPLQDHPFQRTTWSDWIKQHPDTTVYIGRTQPTAGETTG